MSNESAIRFVYRFRPVLAIVVLLAISIISASAAIYLWLGLPDPLWDDLRIMALLLLCVSAGSLVGLGLLRSVTLIVEDDNLIVMRRSFIRLWSHYDVYPRDAIGCIWYGRAIRGRYRQALYSLVMHLKDSRQVPLVKSESIALPTQMPSKLAEALNTSYVNALDQYPGALSKER